MDVAVNSEKSPKLRRRGNIRMPVPSARVLRSAVPKPMIEDVAPEADVPLYLSNEAVDGIRDRDERVYHPSRTMFPRHDEFRDLAVFTERGCIEEKSFSEKGVPNGGKLKRSESLEDCTLLDAEMAFFDGISATDNCSLLEFIPDLKLLGLNFYNVRGMHLASFKAVLDSQLFQLDSKGEALLYGPEWSSESIYLFLTPGLLVRAAPHQTDLKLVHGPSQIVYYYGYLKGQSVVAQYGNEFYKFYMRCYYAIGDQPLRPLPPAAEISHEFGNYEPMLTCDDGLERSADEVMQMHSDTRLSPRSVLAAVLTNKRNLRRAAYSMNIQTDHLKAYLCVKERSLGLSTYFSQLTHPKLKRWKDPLPEFGMARLNPSPAISRAMAAGFKRSLMPD